MNHPAIAKVFDAGETQDGQPYFVMEYVAGRASPRRCFPPMSHQCASRRGSASTSAASRRPPPSIDRRDAKKGLLVD